MNVKCQLCENPAEMSYEIDVSNPRPLCSHCFGRWRASELNSLLGIVPTPVPSQGIGLPPQRGPSNRAAI